MGCCRYETIGTLDEVIRDELSAVRNCSILSKASASSTVELLDGTRVDMPLLEWGSPTCWPRGSNSFISKDFFVRGVYRTIRSSCACTSSSPRYALRRAGLPYYVCDVQCLAMYPQANVLVLEDTELRDSPADTMAKVWEFAGLPQFNVSHLTNVDVYNR